jgi:hypothetical protein
LCGIFQIRCPNYFRRKSQGIANSTNALIAEAAARATKTKIRPFGTIALFDMPKAWSDSDRRVSGEIWCLEFRD